MRHTAFKLLAAAVVLTIGTVAPVLAQTAATASMVTYELENGLKVILAPDHKVPKVTMTVRYKVGSLNEPAGRSGFAHLFEHLMLFAGTPAYPKIDATYTGLGITYNGFTQEDGTTYYASGMASTLPVMLSVQADQMANIGTYVDQGDVDVQRGVVLNEMRQNVLDTPAAATSTALQSGMFPKGHPYSRAVIGSIPDLQAATLDEVREFFSAYYAPNNAVLAIVGDLDIAATKAMIEDTFGRIARGNDVIQPNPGPFPPTKARIETQDALATPLVYLAFTGPNVMSTENASLSIAGDLMSNESGLLRAELINTGLANYAGGYWTPGKLGGRFIIYAGAGPNVTAEQLEAALRATVAKFIETPVNVADLERTRSGMLISDRTSLEAYEARAMYLARTMALKGDVTSALEDDPDTKAATAQSVEAAIHTYLNFDSASSAVVMPGARGEYPSVLSDASGTPAPLLAAVRQAVEIPKLTAGEPRLAELPTREETTLSNGIRLVHYRMTGAPMVYMSTAVTGGGNNDPRGKEGLYSIAVDMAWRGAGDNDLQALSRALKDIDGTVGTWSGAVMSGATLQVPPEHLDAGIDLLADVVQKPQFPASEWDVVKSGTLNYIVQRDNDLTGVAQRAMNRVIFFPGENEPEMNMSVKSVEAITLEDARAAYDEMVVPKTMVIYSVGDVSLDQVKTSLETRFGHWTKAGDGIASRATPTAVFPKEQQVYLVPMPGTSQATIHIAREAPGYLEPTYASASAVSSLLAGDFGSRLNSVIREQKGYSYGVSGLVWNWYLKDSGMSVTIPVQIDATGAALAEVFKGFDSLSTVPVTADEVNRTVTANYTALATLPETAAGFFNAFVGWEKEGIDFNRTIASLRAMTKLQVTDVQAEALRLALLDHAVVIISGDPALILPQLKALGITDVRTVPPMRNAG